MRIKKLLLLLTSLIGITVIAYLRSNYLYTIIVDDAYFFFRYAENVVSGHGFVWNIGEQPVEGYSSFFYQVIFIAAKAIELNPELLSIVIGIVCSAMVLFTTFLIYNYLNSELFSENIFTVIIIGLTPSFLYWSAAGMETSLYSMFLMLTLYSIIKLPETLKYTVIKGILFGLLFLIRFEAVIFFIFSLLYLMKDENSNFRFRVNKAAIIFAVTFGIIFISYFIWRWNYFGQFLPNTYYAKTGGGIIQILGGLDYTIFSFKRFFGLGWILIFLVLLFFRFKMLSGKHLFLFGCGIISVITTILIGGDHFYGGRFLLPVLPLLLIVLPSSLHNFLQQKFLIKLSKKMLMAAFYLLIIGTLIYKLPFEESFYGILNLIKQKKDTVIVYDNDIKDYIIEWQNGFNLMGKELKEISDTDDYIAAIPIGAIGYYSRIGAIDMVGIVDPVIAKEDLSHELLKKWIPGHNKGDGYYILSRKPKYIQLVDFLTRKPHKKPYDSSFRFKSIKEIWFSDEFHEDYEFRPIEIINGWYYNLFVRKN